MSNVEIVESAVLHVDVPPLGKKGDTVDGQTHTMVFDRATGMVSIGRGPTYVQVPGHHFLYLKTRSQTAVVP